MLNIISIQALRKKSTGPSKLAKNLIKGLELINEPYVINGNPYIYKNIYVIDDGKFLMNMKDIPNDIEIFLGPIIEYKGKDIEQNISNYTFVYASNWIKNLGDKYGWHKKSICRPVGIDTYKYSDTQMKKELKDIVLIYTKRRKEDEFKYVINILNKLNIKYIHIDYDKGYKEDDFIKYLKLTKYVIYLGGSETQGIALEEILSMNIPVLIRDIKKVINYENKNLWQNNYSNTEINEFATSAEYFDETCGIKFYNRGDLLKNILYMEKCYKEYKPREYILKNLSLEKQARELLNYYKDSERGDNIKKPKFILKNILIRVGFVFIDSKIGNWISPLIFKIYTFYLKTIGK